DLSRARLAGVGCAGADGARLRAARRGRVLPLRASAADGGAERAAVSGIEVGLVIFGVMLTLMVVRVPIGIAMFIVGFGGYLYLTGGNLAALLNSLKNLAYARLSNYDLVVIPLFLLMGQFATHGGLSKGLLRFVG